MATRDPKDAAGVTSDFIVRLEGVELPSDARERIAAGIRGIVMKELPGVDFGGDVSARIPFRGSWLGMWLRRAQLERTIDLQLTQIKR